MFKRMFSEQFWKWWLITLAIIGSIIIPHIFSEYDTMLVEIFFVNAIFALSFNILLGYSGLLSFNHAAYLGVGAYGVGLLMQKLDMNYFLAIPISLAITAIVSAIIGYFCSRVTAMSFAILTLAFGELLSIIVLKWYGFTGGNDGIQHIYPPDIIASTNNFYYFTLIIFVIGVFAMWRVVNSPFGYALRALKDDRSRSQAIGIDVKGYQWMAFIVAGVFAGLAGCAFATLNNAVTPSDLGAVKGAEAIVMTILGGQFVFVGPIVGALIFTFFQFYVGQLTLYWGLIIGVIIALVMLFMPAGVCGFIQKMISAKRHDQNDSSD